MKTSINFYGRTVNIHGLKKEVQAIADHFSRLSGIKSYKRELTNSMGKDEAYVYWVCFGNFPLRDEKQFLEDVAAINIPDPVTADPAVYKPLFKAIDEVFDKHVFVQDLRKTPEQRAQEAQERAEAAAAAEEAKRQRDAANEPLFAIYSGNEEISIPAGFAAVTIQAYYDNSDIMTDYWHRHCSIGSCYVVALVPAGTKRTEAIHRAIVENSPVLSAYSWEWNVEEYANGHGTYLKSEIIGTAQQRTYAGQDTAPVWLEIKIDKYPSKAMKSKLFVDLKQQQEPASAATGEGVTIRINTAQGGVEIKHASKPAQHVIDAIKREGFRWAKYSKCWYKKDSPSARAAAERLTGLKLETAGSRDQGGDMLDAAMEQEQDAWAAANL